MGWPSERTSFDRRAGALAFAGVLAAAEPTFAAHPLITEDAGTQGFGKFELENGWQRARQGDATSTEYRPQLSYGLADAVDLIVQPSWVEEKSEQGTRRRGAGDANVDLKWRFREASPASFGVRGGVALPTGNADKGLGAGRTSPHATLVASVDTAPVAYHGNIGYARNPVDGERGSLWHASFALLWTLIHPLRFSAELAADTSPDPAGARWERAGRLGAISTLAEGIDIDVGWEQRHGAATSRTLLVGLTLRW